MSNLYHTQNKNASSFDILSFNPTNQNSQDNNEKLRKKEKQSFYKDQLDQMVCESKDRKLSAKSSTNDSTFGRDASNYQGYSNQNQYQHNDNYSDMERYQNRTPPVLDSFQQQDQLREQLLNKMRSGYNQQNNNTYNTYEKPQQTNQNKYYNDESVNRAAQEKFQKENELAMSQWDQKKKLQRDMNLANQEAIREKAERKRRETQRETVDDQQRVQDSLARFEREDYHQKEASRRMRDDNTKVLEQQRVEHLHRQKPSRESQNSDYDRSHVERIQRSTPFATDAETHNIHQLASSMNNVHLRDQQNQRGDDIYQGYSQGGSNFGYSNSSQQEPQQIRTRGKQQQQQQQGGNFNIITGEYR